MHRPASGRSATSVCRTEQLCWSRDADFRRCRDFSVRGDWSRVRGSNKSGTRHGGPDKRPRSGTSGGTWRLCADTDKLLGEMGTPLFVGFWPTILTAVPESQPRVTEVDVLGLRKPLNAELFGPGFGLCQVVRPRFVEPLTSCPNPLNFWLAVETVRWRLDFVVRDPQLFAG